MIYYLLVEDSTNEAYKLFSTHEKCVEYLCNKYPNDKIIHNLVYNVYVAGELLFFDPTYYIIELKLDEKG